MRFDSLQRKYIFFFSIASRPALGPTQPHTQWVSEAVCPGVKQQGHEADYLPPSITEVKNVGPVLVFPHIFSWHGLIM
jgi:hypothetical protein